MKTTDKKAEFIELRAKGLSYAKIAEQLHISKSTGSSSEGLQSIKTLRRSELAEALEQRQDEAQNITINVELTE